MSASPAAKNQPHGLPVAQITIPVGASDGSTFELLCVVPEDPWRQLLVWLPAMGVPARHYLPLAEGLAALGVAVAIHEWRGIGSSNRRAGRRDNWGYRELLTVDLPVAMATVHAQWPQARCWLGGHSLGGQLGALYAAMHPHEQEGLILVASGLPYWRCFRHGGLIGASYAIAPLLAAAVGHLPGRRIGFGGNEARGVIADWSRSGRTGHYTAMGMDQNLEQLLAQSSLPILALRLRDDWLGPQASLEALLQKMPQARRTVQVITSQDLDDKAADHFGWMKTPAAMAARIADWVADPTANDGPAT